MGGGLLLAGHGECMINISVLMGWVFYRMTTMLPSIAQERFLSDLMGVKYVFILCNYGHNH